MVFLTLPALSSSKSRLITNGNESDNLSEEIVNLTQILFEYEHYIYFEKKPRATANFVEREQLFDQAKRRHTS